MSRTHLLAALLFFAFSTSGIPAQGNSSDNVSNNASSISAGSGNENISRQGQSSNNNSNSAPPNSKPEPPLSVDAEEEALNAVQSGQAVPLSRIVGILERTNGGKVLDAKLVKAGDVLLYRLKLLLPNGSVITESYHAPTGQLIDQQ
jgi:hypothetical protein